MNLRTRWLWLTLAGAWFWLAPAIRGDEAGGAVRIMLAYWEPDELWYPAKVENAEGPKFLVRYYDGTTEWKPKAQVVEHNLRAGTQVYANWQNKGRYYAGTIQQIDGERLRIQYADGDVEDTTVKAIRMNLDIAALLQVGVRVFARWEADGYWYPASIIEIKEKQYRVRFDDDLTSWCAEDAICKYAVTPGDRLEGNWIGQGRYYAGEVMSRKGKQIHIRYDDGDEEDTTVDMVRMKLKIGAREP